MVLGGSNVDYGVAPGLRVSETPTKATPSSGGVYTYTMTNVIPAAATGSFTISMEAANTVTLLPGTTQQVSATDSAIPVEYYFSVDSSPTQARRVVVSLSKCGGCHQNLAFVHGGTRGNTTECVICHNPTLADGTSKQSVSFATQIHSIHRGSNLTNPYVLGTTNYQEVLFPGDLRDCSQCHVNSSEQLPLTGFRLPVNDPKAYIPVMGAETAACLACHDTKGTAAHASANTTSIGESCDTCHGSQGAYSVSVVHAH